MDLLTSTIYYYRVDRSRIAFVKFILEACDGIATMSTVDPQKGIVLFRVAPGCEPDFNHVLSDLKKEILFEEWDPAALEQTG